MKILPARRGENETGYKLVSYEDGRVTCSCGRELIQVDEDTYRCAGGYPYYRFSEDEVMKDKFGNLFLKLKQH